MGQNVGCRDVVLRDELALESQVIQDADLQTFILVRVMAGLLPLTEN
ncbi:hypothetical protein [Pseudomonas sp. DG56-2]|nr:hypothetical protein [Pseudomonas sp. DG56-2]